MCFKTNSIIIWITIALLRDMNVCINLTKLYFTWGGGGSQACNKQGFQLILREYHLFMKPNLVLKYSEVAVLKKNNIYLSFTRKLLMNHLVTLWSTFLLDCSMCPYLLIYIQLFSLTSEFQPFPRHCAKLPAGRGRDYGGRMNNVFQPNQHSGDRHLRDPRWILRAF